MDAQGYQPDDPVILKMLRSGSFDAAVADARLTGADFNEPICDEPGYPTTYLNEAVSSNDPKAVQYFLEHGADPNYNRDDVIPLWELQYAWDIEDEQGLDDMYEIQKLFFRYGADPNLIYENEGLYDSVVFTVYNDPPGELWWKNLLRFYKLLVLYGGGGLEYGYGKPDLKNVDISKPDDYSVRFRICDDGYHIVGLLVDREEKVVAEL